LIFELFYYGIDELLKTDFRSKLVIERKIQAMSKMILEF